MINVNTTGVPKVKGFDPSAKKIDPEKDKTIKNLEELSKKLGSEIPAVRQLQADSTEGI